MKIIKEKTEINEIGKWKKKQMKQNAEYLKKLMKLVIGQLN